MTIAVCLPVIASFVTPGSFPGSSTAIAPRMAYGIPHSNGSPVTKPFTFDGTSATLMGRPDGSFANGMRSGMPQQYGMMNMGMGHVGMGNVNMGAGMMNNMGAGMMNNNMGMTGGRYQQSRYNMGGNQQISTPIGRSPFTFEGTSSTVAGNGVSPAEWSTNNMQQFGQSRYGMRNQYGSDRYMQQRSPYGMQGMMEGNGMMMGRVMPTRQMQQRSNYGALAPSERSNYGMQGMMEGSGMMDGRYGMQNQYSQYGGMQRSAYGNYGGNGNYQGSMNAEDRQAMRMVYGPRGGFGMM